MKKEQPRNKINRFQECCFIYLPSKGKRAIWELTHSCPYSCDYCFTSSTKELERNKKILAFKQTKFLDFFAKMKVSDVLLTGGEPLSLEEVLIGIIKSLRKNSITYSLSTSGRPLSYFKQIAEFSNDLKPRRVNLSFDPKEDRNPNFWKSNYAYVDQLINMLERNEIPVKLTSVITKTNMQNFGSHIIRLSELVRTHKNLRNIAITNPYSIGRGLECEGLSLKEIKKLHEEIKNKSKEKFPSNCTISLINFPSLNKPLQVCPAGNSVFSLMPDGNVTPCSMLYNLSRSFGIGNVLVDSAETIVSRMECFIDGVNTHINEIKTQNKRCMKCNVIERCGGGCFATMPVVSLDHAERIICKTQPKLITDQQKKIFRSIEKPPQAVSQIPSTTRQKSKLHRKVENKIWSYLKNRRPKTDPAHSLEHIENTVAIAKYIASQEGANEKIVATAAYLHDLAPRNHSMHHFHTVKSARLAEIILKPMNAFSEEEIFHIQQCIVTASYGSYLMGYEPQTIEAMIVRDADFLEAIGARGVARTFAFGAYYGSSEMGSVEHSPRHPPTIFDMNLTGPDHSPIHHFFTKLLKLKNLILTQTGKQLASRRHAFMIRFLEEYAFEESLGRNKTLQSTLEEYYRKGGK